MEREIPGGFGPIQILHAPARNTPTLIRGEDARKRVKDIKFSRQEVLERELKIAQSGDWAC